MFRKNKYTHNWFGQSTVMTDRSIHTTSNCRFFPFLLSRKGKCPLFSVLFFLFRMNTRTIFMYERHKFLHSTTSTPTTLCVCVWVRFFRTFYSQLCCCVFPLICCVKTFDKTLSPSSQLPYYFSLILSHSLSHFLSLCF